MNRLEEIEELMEQGYSEDDACRVVAMLHCSDDELFDIWNE